MTTTEVPLVTVFTTSAAISYIEDSTIPLPAVPLAAVSQVPWTSLALLQYLCPDRCADLIIHPLGFDVINKIVQQLLKDHLATGAL